MLRSTARAERVSGFRDLVGQRGECALDRPPCIIVKQVGREVDQLNAHALHHSKQIIEALRGLAGGMTFELSHDLFEPRNRGHKRASAFTIGEFDDLCSHARVLRLFQAAADAARQSLRTDRSVRCSQVLMVPTGTPKRCDKLARLSPSR